MNDTVKNIVSIPLALVFIAIAVPAYIIAGVAGSVVVFLKWIRDWG